MQSFLQRKDDTIYTSHMPVLGVSISHELISRQSTLNYLSPSHAHRPQIEGARGCRPLHFSTLGNGRERYLCIQFVGLLPSQTVHSPLGWRFAKSDERIPGDNVTPDPIHDGYTHLRDIYLKDDPEYIGRFTVPTLYDMKQGKIVNNEVYISILIQCSLLT